jgi:hypothetical protein
MLKEIRLPRLAAPGCLIDRAVFPFRRQKTSLDQFTYFLYRYQEPLHIEIHYTFICKFRISIISLLRLKYNAIPVSLSGPKQADSLDIHN